MADYIKLTFLTDEDNKVSINIPNPNPAITEAEVSQAMDDIIASEAIQSTAGVLSLKYSAELVTVNEVKLV